MKTAKIVERIKILTYVEGSPKTIEEKLLYSLRGGRIDKTCKEKTVGSLVGKNKKEITAKFWEWVLKNKQYDSRNLFLEFY